jgi:DNA-binding NtrC family response regulator
MPLVLQGKLLRVLQESEVLPLGSGEAVKVDVRVVAATNVDPARLLREGKLRKDLYYRLSVVRLALPPLRDRTLDVPLLAELFLERACTQAGAAVKHLSPRAVSLLVSHDWPGNVRELQNVIERATLMSGGDEIGPGEIVLEGDDLEWQPEAEEGLGYEEAKRRVLLRFQHRYVEQVMGECGGNLSAAARKAGITRAALHRIVKRLGLHAEEEESAAGSNP